MTYERIKHLKPEEFKRLCGVHPETFNQIVIVMQQAKQQLKPGRPSKLSLEDQVLMTLEYLREYRTYFHIAQTWGVYESTAYRIIRSVEDTLISSGKFSLPGKKKLLEPEHTIEVVVVDVTESPIERPQKNRNATTAAKRNSIHSTPK
jgi:transposase